MPRQLSILNVAYPFARVGPDAVGGAEQILTAIDEALMAAGHVSFVIAQEGSRTAGSLLPLPSVDVTIRSAERACIQAAVADVIENVLRNEPIDLVHFHGIDALDYLPPGGVPALITLHLPPDWYPADIWSLRRPDTWLHAVSASQHASCPDGWQLLSPIANGVPVERLAAGPVEDHGHALVLGRICPEKGQHLAIAAARQAQVPLLIAGAVFAYPEHEDYFRTQIGPKLATDCRFVGPVGFEAKRRLLARAHCVLIPSLVAETSSLVAMEAAAAGTPVIAFRRGALSDTVRDGHTGYVVDTVDAMAEAFGRLGQIDRAACRQYARAHFDQARTTRAYLARYEELVAVHVQ